MKKILVFTFALFLCASTIFGQPTWFSPVSSPDGAVYHAVNTAPPNTPLHAKCLIAGSFPARVATLSYNQIVNISGFQSDDKILGFFYRNNSWYVYGSFKRTTPPPTKYYPFMQVDFTNNSAVPVSDITFTGPTAPQAFVTRAGSDTLGNIIVTGDNLRFINGINLNSSKVGYIENDNTVTPLTDLTYSHSSETAQIYAVKWDSIWVIAGNFNELGGSTCHDLARWNGATMFPVNSSTEADAYCTYYNNHYVSWTGTTLQSGDDSPGAFYLNGTSTHGLNGGWSGIPLPLSICTVGANVWLAGKTGVATYNALTEQWIDQTGNLFTPSDTATVFTIVPISGDTMVACGNFNGNGFNYVAMAAVYNPPLPVKLISFSGRLIEKSVELTWTTGSEKDNFGFYVEHSVDGVNWKLLGFVEGKGTTAVENEYTFTDEKPISGVNYYRLKQSDQGGTFAFSLIISVDLPTEKDFQLFPNPANRRLNFNFGDGQKNIKISLFDATGKITLVKTYPEVITASMDLSGLLEGIYTVVVEDNNGNKKRKPLIIMR